jgi:hypothetical protein
MDYIKYSNTLAKNKQIIDLLNREIELLKKQNIIQTREINIHKQIIQDRDLSIKELHISNQKLNHLITQLKDHINKSDNIISDYQNRLDNKLLSVPNLNKKLEYFINSVKIKETDYATDNILELLRVLPNKIISTYIELKDYQLNTNILLFSKYGKYINKHNTFGKNIDCVKCSNNTVHIPLECCHYICCNCIFTIDKCPTCKCLYDLDFSIKL